MLLGLGLQDAPLGAAGPDGVLLGVVPPLHALLALGLQEGSTEAAQGKFTRDIPGWTSSLGILGAGGGAGGLAANICQLRLLQAVRSEAAEGSQGGFLYGAQRGQLLERSEARLLANSTQWGLVSREETCELHLWGSYQGHHGAVGLL